MPNEHLVETIRGAIEWAALGIEVLGLLVLVRTFLSWSLAVEIEGHWPWQAKKAEASHAASRSPT